MPITLTIKRACKLSGLGRTTIFKLISTAELPAHKHGRRTLILYEDLRRYLEQLPTVAPRGDEAA